MASKVLANNIQTKLSMDHYSFIEVEKTNIIYITHISAMK